MKTKYQNQNGTNHATMKHATVIYLHSMRVLWANYTQTDPHLPRMSEEVPIQRTRAVDEGAASTVAR
jgi:hypothetical protein